MDKYIIVNEAYNSILCKDKYSSRRYRQDRNNIHKHCVIVKTTKGRAENERDYLNKNYNEGWEIQKVETIVFYNNVEDREKYLTEYETLNKEEIKEIEKQMAKKILNYIEETFEWLQIDEVYDIHEFIVNQFGVEIKEN